MATNTSNNEASFLPNRLYNEFYYKKNTLYCESVNLETLAVRYGTPLYVYSAAALLKNWHEYQKVLSNLPHQICYAVKANSNIAILNLLAKQGAGFDIVSGGELKRVLAAHGDPKKIIFSGVGKTEHEIALALDADIFCFDVESEAELERIHTIAQQKNKVVNVACRINPHIDAGTHTHIATGLKENKFGIDFDKAFAFCIKITWLTHVKLIGIACHIGSQITELFPFLQAIDRLLALHQDLMSADIKINSINIGGGLGVHYHRDAPPTIQAYLSAMIKKIKSTHLKLIIEPGRALIADTGILLTRIEYLKHTTHRNFAITDAGMNDLMRPALYDAWHDILPVTLNSKATLKAYDIVGPVCESADFLGKNRKLSLTNGDLLALMHAGAYGFCMSSNYNTRPRPAEILIRGDQAHLIRQRESIEALYLSEKMID